MSRKFLTAIDLSKNEIQNAVLQVLAGDPAAPLQGQMYFSSAVDRPLFRTTSAFIDLTDRANHSGTQLAATISDFAAAVAATAAVTANTAKVTNATHTGDVTGATALTIAANVVTNTKLADMATATVKGRATAGSGDPEDLTAAQVRTILNVADGATSNSSDATLLARANHTGTQTAATISDFSAAVAATASVTANTAKVTNATHTGDVTGSGALTIANNVVTNAKLADMATATMKGRVTAATGDPEDLTAAQVRTLLNVADGADVNVQSDWNAVAGDAFILNKPTLGTAAAAATTDFAPAAHVGAGGGAHADATTSVSGFMSGADKTKLNGIATGATANSADATLLARANHTGTQLAATISNFDTQVRTSTLNQMAVPTASVSLNSQKITSLANGTAATDAATYGQLQDVLNGRQFKDAVRCATTANITLSGLQTIDGITVVAGDRVLVKDQTTTTQNGIYVAASGAWTRATDADNATVNTEVKTGMSVLISEGTTLADQQWSLTTNGSITIGTTGLTFAKTGAGTTYTQGTGIDITGSVISVDLTVVPRKYAATIGGSTSSIVSHNLNTLDVVVNVVEISSGDTIECDVKRNSVNQVTLGFAVAPAASSMRVIVIG